MASPAIPLASPWGAKRSLTMNKPVARGIDVPTPAALIPKLDAVARSSFRKVGLIVALLVLPLAAGAAWWMLGSAGPVQYSTAPVTRGAVMRAVTAPGTLNPPPTILA